MGGLASSYPTCNILIEMSKAFSVNSSFLSSALPRKYHLLPLPQTSISVPSTQWEYCASFGYHFPAPWSGRCLKAESLCNRMAYFLCFLFLRNYSSMLSFIQCLKTVFLNIFCQFPIVLSRTENPALVTTLWLDMKSPLIIFKNSFIDN